MNASRVLISLCLVFTPLGAQDRPDAAIESMAIDPRVIESKIIAMEKAWNQAYKLRDTKAIDSLLDNSIVLVNDDGSLQSKKVFMEWIRNSKPSEDEQVTPESLSVQVYANVAVATGVFRTSGVEGGKPYARRDRFVDTWQNQKGSWVCVSASATPVLH
jgi:ketosteroid isomerase-like protein